MDTVFKPCSKIYYLLFFTLFLQPNQAHASDDNKVEKEPQAKIVVENFAPSFRSGHNLSLFFSAENMSWTISQPSSSSNPDGTILSTSGTKIIPSYQGRYTYHINMLSGFGFFIGSTIGFLGSGGSYGSNDSFYPGPGFMFPSALGGLVQNLSQSVRLKLGVEYGATWYPQMKANTVAGHRRELNPTLDTLSIFLCEDNVISHNIAISLGLVYRQIKNTCFNNCDNSLYLNTLNIKGSSIGAQLGLNWLINNINP